jgi:signal transduction histidine kinase
VSTTPHASGAAERPTGAEPAPPTQHRFWRPAILAIGLAISFAVAGVVHDMLSQETTAQREIARQSLAAGLQSEIDRQIGFLALLRGLYDSSDFVSAEEFHNFVELDHSMRDAPWWLSVAWAAQEPHASASYRPSLEEGDIFRRTYVAPTDQGDATPVILGDNPIDRAAMVKAVQTGAVAVTPPRPMSFGEREALGIRAVLPVYSHDSGPAERRLTGFVVETIAIDGFFVGFLGDDFANTNLSVRISDGKTQLFALGEAGDDTTAGELTVGDRVWRMEVDGVGAIVTSLWLPGLVFVIGLALTGMLYLRLLRADTEYLRIAEEVTRATGELAEANGRLTERTHRLQEAADELRRSSREAQLANAAKSVFLANMSHELRTPLNAVIGFSDMIASRALGDHSPRYVEYAQDIGASGRYLLSIIEDLLEMSRIELGKLKLKEESLLLDELASDVMKFVSFRAAEKGITLRRSGFDDLPRILADAKAIRQSLINLLTNAVKFSHPGSAVEVRASVEADGLALRVVDQGSGIRPEDLDNIFEPFWQAEAYRSKHKEGIGLGLAITRRLIEAHGGKIEIESSPGAGTTVIILLPSSRIMRERPQLSVVGGSDLGGTDAAE